MARPQLSAARVPTPGPWLVHGEPEAEFSLPAVVGDAATEEQAGGSYLIRQDQPLVLGEANLPIAFGIRRLADATLMAAAPDLAAALLALLTSPDLTRRDLDTHTRAALTVAWDLLVRVAPHLEI